MPKNPPTLIESHTHTATHYLLLQSSFILHRHVVVHGEGQHVKESGGQFQQYDHKGLHGIIGDIL